MSNIKAPKYVIDDRVMYINDANEVFQGKICAAWFKDNKEWIYNVAYDYNVDAKIPEDKIIQRVY